MTAPPLIIGAAQRAVNHLTLDGARRVRIDLPEMLDLDDLLATLHSFQGSFDVRVRQASGSLYVLNLAECHGYLSAIRQKLAVSRRNHREFIDCEVLKAEQWEDCVDESNPLENLMACLSIWGNMPSRASYSYVRRGQSSTEEDMDVEDSTDRAVVIMAAQLSRIVCRKLEVSAYSYLQKVLNEWSTLSASEVQKFVRELGLVLLTLRWRISWWTLLGDGGNTPDTKGKEAFAYRVHSLCRVLYFYYCMMRRKLPTWSSKKEFYGTWSTYPDTALPVFEEFPEEESLSGFEAWMRNGQRLIFTAGVEGKLAGIGLRHERV
ncbi:uncharacterized protein LTR77_001329 [Saxophila tyrrhenica]|uniref:Uncharacterized protein n=1 Tax=Saxophila tyrrhenica TaxID=1690608 RepID=A0AAV9PNE6_9PEZI|nr:hypothetical protein LTR77_001329 [Saxophila tyrrhenica]